MLGLIKMMSQIIKDPIWVSKNNNLIYVNSKFEEVFGLTVESINDFNFEYEDKLEKIIKDTIINKKDGVNVIYKDREYNHKIFKDANEVNAYEIGVYEVISEFDAENENPRNLLNTIIDNIPELIFYKDSKGVYRGANKHCLEFYKSRGVENIIGKSDLELPLDKQFLETCVNHDKTVMDTKELLQVEEQTFDEYGNNRILETIKTPVLNQNNEVWGIVGVVRDITETKMRMIELKKMSFVDKLTGLYNRAHFDKMIQELDNDDNYPLSIIMGDVNGLKVTNDAFGHFEGDKLLIDIANVVKNSCREEDLVFRWGGDEIAIILPNTNLKESKRIKERILQNCKDAPHSLIPLSISMGTACKENKSDNIDDIIKFAETKLYKQKLISKQKFFYGKVAISFIVDSIRNNLSNKIVDIDEHIENTCKYSKIIGEELGFSKKELEELELAATLHDIGLAGVGTQHLCKTMLDIDKEDIALISEHCEKGFRIIKSYSDLEHISKVILNHHENWDGTGYPFGIKHKNIPLNSRIIHLASDCDIIMRRNKDKNEETFKEETIKAILSEKGKSFDPKLVELLIKNKYKL